MRFAVAVAVVAAVAPIAAEPRRDLPPGVTERARELFEKARERDDAADLPGALRYYREAGQIDPHPNTAYNIADVLRRMKRYRDAIEAYQRYLQISPDAADRASVEQLIAQLEATPGTLEIGATTEHEQAFVDGAPIGILPQTVELREGRHVVDVITPISYGWMFCEVRAGQKQTCKPSPVPRMDGNVVISGSTSLSSKRWRETGAFFMLRERFELRHGHYTLGDLVYKQCKPFDIEVARGEDVLTFAFVTTPDERPKNSDCAPVSVRVQTVKL
jgi:tetratricopeptide (TPR) repeat protein